MSMELRRALDQVAGRFRRLRLWASLAAGWLAWAAVAAALAYAASRPGGLTLPAAAPAWIAGLAAITGFVLAAIALRSVGDRLWVARRVESRYPELKSGLLAAVEEDAAPGRRGFLRDAVIAEALSHRKGRDWDQAVPDRSLGLARLAHASALALLLVAGVALAVQARPREGDRASRSFADAAAVDVQVEPGHAEIEKGTTLLVVARFPNDVPADATLVVEGGPPSSAPRAMTRSLDDPTFAGRVESVDSDLTYRVAFDGKATEPYRVRVFEYPALLRADARLDFPDYTAMPTKVVQDIRHVTAVEGTGLTLTLRLNKEVATALLVDESGAQTPLIAVGPGAAPPGNETSADLDQDAHAYHASWTLADSHRYKLRLVDREGRANKIASEIAVNVMRNRPPVVAMSQPGRDVRVSPVEELRLKARLDDDFGVVRHGLNYTVADAEPRDLAFDVAKPGTKRVEAEHLLDFESFRAEPDQLVTYFAWAEDVGPDGQPRRTSGDLFFAEVRHFEEVFRQGEAPPPGSASEQEGGNAQAADKLAELQKDIINGIWTLVRRESAPRPAPVPAEDSEALLASQRAAIEQAGAMSGRLRDAASKASLAQAVKFMKDSEKTLAVAKAAPVAAHRPALAPAQAAYQALLKLRAREFEVTRQSRSQSPGSSSSSRSQQQLDQLELKPEENRFEERRNATAKEATKKQQEQAEDRQVLNRLKELARRQNDLNDRLKEMQAALEAAKDPQAREEIERQLKRLRDQQQEVLRDTDELRERMEQEPNRERMAEARQQVEQGRENLRRAAEALEQDRLSQAVTEGARAGQTLEELKEQMQRNSSERFSKEMTEMRARARTLDEVQGRLTEQLQGQGRRPAAGLRDQGREQARAGLEDQAKQLDKLTEQMQNTVQEAEEAQPLLAKELFDAARKAEARGIPDALKTAERLAGAGIADDAAQVSRKAGEGISQLREGVDRAARSVLGDEAETLRRARAELDDLADQVDREIARAMPPTPPGAAGAKPADQQPGQPGAQGPPDAQTGEPGQQGATGEQPGQPGQPGQQGQTGRGGQQPRPGQRGQGNQPGQQPRPGEQGQPGQGGQPGEGNQPGQQGQPGEGNQPEGQGQPGQGNQPGQPGRGGQQGTPGQGGNQPGQQGRPGQGGSQPGQQGQPGGPGNRRGGRGGQGGGPGGDNAGGNPSGVDRMLEGFAGGRPDRGGPIAGDGFRQFSDRLRDVEELLDDPALRAEAARIREAARGAREEAKRHSKIPDPAKLQGLVADPIRVLRDRVAEELRRRESPDSLVPIDRDPVPPQFAEGVRRYYERLGSGR